MVPEQIQRVPTALVRWRGGPDVHAAFIRSREPDLQAKEYADETVIARFDVSERG